MTAEIAVMNRAGVALAADSAVSIATSSGNTKVYNANKLFTLSKFQPVGVMIYGNADLLNVPWETAIKVYRNNELKDTKFKTLREYGDHFVGFLNNNSALFPAEDQAAYVYATMHGIFSRIGKQIDSKIKRKTQTGVPKVSLREIQQIADDTIQETFEILGGFPSLATVTPGLERRTLSKYFKIVEQAIDDIFQKHPLSKASRKKLRRIGVGLFARDLFDAKDGNGRQLIPSSGLVIAGFGADEIYPSLVGYEMEGVVDGLVKYRESVTRKIGSEMSATLIPFAQREMVFGFMDGVTPDYKDALYVALKELFDKYPDKIIKGFGRISAKRKVHLRDRLKTDGEELLELFWNSLNEWAKTTSADPIVDTIADCPFCR